MIRKIIDTKSDQWYRDGTEEIRHTIQIFNEAVRCLLGREHRRCLDRLIGHLEFLGDSGLELVGQLFSRAAPHLPRRTRAEMLTQLARAHHERTMSDHGIERPIRESEVSRFGLLAFQFMKDPMRDMEALKYGGPKAQEGRPVLAVEWFVDMGQGDGISPQPTSVLRGIVFSHSVRQEDISLFWKEAASVKEFPERIFFDPCLPDEGNIFSPYLFRVFGHFFSVAPEPAVRRFAAVMRDAANQKIVWQETVTDDIRRRDLRAVPIDEADRERVLRSVIGHIENMERNKFVSSIFQAAA